MTSAVNRRFRRIRKGGTGVSLLLLLFLSGCQEQRKQPEFHVNGPIMGTSFAVKVPELPAAVDQTGLDETIKKILAGIDSRFSTYIESSELSQFNRTKTSDWISASKSFVEVLTEALHVSRITGGAFDVTVGPLVNLWGFGPRLQSAKPPHQDSIRTLLASIGYEHLRVRIDPPGVKKNLPDIYVDLSAIAKGYAVDRVAEYLESRDINGYMIEIGGELRAKGLNSNHQAWRIAIEKPVSGLRAVDRIIQVDNGAVATSGDYRNYFEANGKRYSHTIDPRTGAPINHKLASVTVLSHATMRADALATALMVLGAEQGFEFARTHNVAALFFVKRENGFLERETPAFGSMVNK